CGCGRSRDDHRRARLGALQARASARHRGARGAARPRRKWSVPLMDETVAAGGQVGRSLPRLEAHPKVTGRAEYGHGRRRPRMLHRTIFRSTLAHGRITRIDTRAAREMPGVHSVVTAADVLKVIPDPYYGPAFHDQPILAIGKVRFVGEPVAVVLSADPHVA